MELLYGPTYGWLSVCTISMYGLDSKEKHCTTMVFGTGCMYGQCVLPFNHVGISSIFVNYLLLGWFVLGRVTLHFVILSSAGNAVVKNVEGEMERHRIKMCQHSFLFFLPLFVPCLSSFVHVNVKVVLLQFAVYFSVRCVFVPRVSLSAEWKCIFSKNSKKCGHFF